MPLRIGSVLAAAIGLWLAFTKVSGGEVQSKAPNRLSVDVAVFAPLGVADNHRSAMKPADSLLTFTSVATTYLPITLRNLTLLYADDFSDPNSGWADYSTPNYHFGYEGGEYEIGVSAKGWYP